MNNEDIKVLEELKETYITSGLYQIGTFELSEREKQAIENLIKGYKELETINKMQEYRISVIDERELIPKSKVRALLKELREEYIQLFELERKDENGERLADCKIVIGEIELLEKLLKEGGK